jgi:hypothetical protein
MYENKEKYMAAYITIPQILFKTIQKSKLSTENFQNENT